MSPEELNTLIDKGDKSALPALRERFRKAVAKVDKQRFATFLVRLGDPDPTYLDFLVKEAKAAVENEMPWPTLFDSQGEIIPRSMSPSFLAWCAQRGVDPEKAAEEAVYGLPLDVAALAMAADPRGFDTLIRGLESKNYMVASQAAEGLARLQDPRAIRPIIQVAQRLPAVFKEAMGRALVFFDDPNAQSAAEQFVKDKAVLSELRKRAKEQGSKGIYGF